MKTSEDQEYGQMEVCRITGLTKHQLEYMVAQGTLGKIRLSPSGDRRFTPAQVEHLRRAATLRAAGIGVEEALVIAARDCPGAAQVPTARIRELARNAFAQARCWQEAALLLTEELDERAACSAQARQSVDWPPLEGSEAARLLTGAGRRERSR